MALASDWKKVRHIAHALRISMEINANSRSATIAPSCVVKMVASALTLTATATANALKNIMATNVSKKFRTIAEMIHAKMVAFATRLITMATHALVLVISKA